MSNALVVKSEQGGQIAHVVDSYRMLVDFVHHSGVMREETDYGKVPGSSKPSLWKPGAEKLGKLFGLKPKFIPGIKVLDWTGVEHGGEPFFHYEWTCRLYHGDPDQGGTFEAEAIRSCNSWESKYRWRWVSREDVPTHLNLDKLRKRAGAISEFDFAIQKAETSGKYGKPAEYWQTFREAIEGGKARKVARKTKAGKEMVAWEIDSTVYRVPNEDVFDQVNTVDGMAQKRAYVAAMLIATSASEFFTLDLEDFADTPHPPRHDDAVDEYGEVVGGESPQPPKPPRHQTPPATAPTNGNGHAEAPARQLPRNGVELDARTRDLEAKMVKAKQCQPGDLLTHVRAEGLKRHLSDDLTTWNTPDAIQVAIDATWAFLEKRKGGKPAADPYIPSSADPDGIKLDNWLRVEGKKLHAEGGCENETSLLDYIQDALDREGWGKVRQLRGGNIDIAVEIARKWLKGKWDAVAADADQGEPVEGEVVSA